jgi:transcription initiation factor TFIIIB Brf1 subunit/transcription initiation factor TFIIB
MFKDKKSQSYPRTKNEKRIIEEENDYNEIFNTVNKLKNSKIINNKDEKYICDHKETIFEENIEICIDCGLKISEEYNFTPEWRFYGDNDNKNSADPNRCQYRKIADKGIRKDLEKMDLSYDVIDIADKLYTDITNGDIKRSNLRKGIMFACVFQAYKNLGKPETPDSLSKKFNINKKNMSKGLTYFFLRTQDKKKDYITAEHFIPKICEKFNITLEHTNNILNLYKKIEDKSSILNRSNPQSVSSALVYYYIKKTKDDCIIKKSIPDITAAIFGKEVDLSEITIINKANEIDDILNNV